MSSTVLAGWLVAYGLSSTGILGFGPPTSRTVSLRLEIFDRKVPTCTLGVGRAR